MRRPTKRVDENDSTPLAGWMYADLLLALMVIFLATVSFVPRVIIPTRSTPTAITQQSAAVKRINSGYNYNLGLSFIYKNQDVSTIMRDIAQFESDNGLAPDSEIIYAQILGGFDHRTQNVNTGKINALAFSIKLGKSQPHLLENTATNIGSSLLLNADEVAVRLTFVSKIGN